MKKSLYISKHYFTILIVFTLLVGNYLLFKEASFYSILNIIIVIFFITILYIGVTRHRLNYFYKSINSGTKNGLSLTFDDGPNPEYTEKVLDILALHKVKATFFIIGKNIKNNEKILQRIFDDGHIIGNHTTNHTYLNNVLPSNKIAKEIIENERLIQEVIGKKPNYYRTPFGLTSPHVARAIKKAKVISIGWDFRSFDTMAKDKNVLLEKLKNNIAKCSIILLHDNNKLTVEILDEFLTYCNTNGTKIVSLDKMIGVSPYKK